MINLLKTLLFITISLLVFPEANAQFGCQFNTNTGEWERPGGGPCVNSIITAVPFLRINPDARTGAMGDVGIAISPDANSMHFNSSKLAFVEKDLGVAVTYTPWLRALGLQDVYMAYLGGYKRLDDLQTIGVGLRYFSLGKISFTDENGQPIGDGRPNEFEIALAYARKLSDKFSVAITPKFIYSNLASGQALPGGVEIQPGIAGAADISFTYNSEVKISGKPSNLAFGLALTNLGTKISYTNSINKDFIPANLGLGFALDINIDQFNKITIAADANKLLVPTPDPDNPGAHKEQSMFSGVLNSFGDAKGGFGEEMREWNYSFGAEYWYDEQFSVRLGYFGEHYTKGNRKFFTVGLGLKYNIFGLNFSYLVPTTSQRNPLDNTLRFTLLFDFSGQDSEEEVNLNF